MRPRHWLGLGARLSGAIVAFWLCLVPAANAGDFAQRRGEVQIIRDAYGVPHIHAASERQLYYGVGFAHAQDRLWQMEILRRQARGRLAEIFGPDLIDDDILSRTIIAPSDALRVQFQQSSPPVKAAVLAYVDGVNAEIDEARQDDALPQEFSYFSPSLPVPWTVEDVYAIASLIGLSVGIFGAEEDLMQLAQISDLQSRLGAEDGAKVFYDMRWVDDPDAFATIPRHDTADTSSRFRRASLHAKHARDFQALHQSLRRLRERQRRAGLLVPGVASNAAVIGSGISASGNAMLLGGPQVGYSVPGFFVEFGVDAHRLRAEGVGVPGLPFVLIGSTDHHAWTMTSGVSKNAYTFIEEPSPENPKQYFFNGALRDMSCRSEIIDAAGGDPVVFEVCSTVHGPLLASLGDIAISVQSPLNDHVHKTMAAFRGFSVAQDIQGFERAVATLPYNFNIMYADSRANIAYWHAGLLAIPPAGADTSLPLSGTGEQELQGFVPFGDLPHARNPKQGYLVNWNNKPQAGWAHSLAGAHGYVNRAGFLDRLTDAYARGSISIDELNEINRAAGEISPVAPGDRFNVPGPFLTDLFISHVDRGKINGNVGQGKLVQEVLSMLSSWNGRNQNEDGDDDYDDASSTIFTAWYEEIFSRTIADELGTNYSAYLNIYEDQAIPANLLHRLYDQTAALPLRHDYLDGQSQSLVQITTDALLAAIDRLKQQYGNDSPSTWREPVTMQNWEIMPLASPSVQDTPFSNRGSYNQIVELRPSGANGINILPPGQSGRGASVHYNDQLEMYADFEYKRMILSWKDIVRAAVTTKVLSYRPAPAHLCPGLKGRRRPGPQGRRAGEVRAREVAPRGCALAAYRPNKLQCNESWCRCDDRGLGEGAGASWHPRRCHRSGLLRHTPRRRNEP